MQQNVGLEKRLRENEMRGDNETGVCILDVHILAYAKKTYKLQYIFLINFNLCILRSGGME